MLEYVKLVENNPGLGCMVMCGISGASGFVVGKVEILG
jgi:hypothetical protein